MQPVTMLSLWTNGGHTFVAICRTGWCCLFAAPPPGQTICGQPHSVHTSSPWLHCQHVPGCPSQLELIHVTMRHLSGKKSQVWWSTTFPPSAIRSSRASHTCTTQGQALLAHNALCAATCCGQLVSEQQVRPHLVLVQDEALKLIIPPWAGRHMYAVGLRSCFYAASCCPSVCLESVSARLSTWQQCAWPLRCLAVHAATTPAVGLVLWLCCGLFSVNTSDLPCGDCCVHTHVLLLLSL